MSQLNKQYCICGHRIHKHDMQLGCTEIVEGSTCEDHWVCGCKCTVCTHLNQSPKAKRKGRIGILCDGEHRLIEQHHQRQQLKQSEEIFLKMKQKIKKE